MKRAGFPLLLLICSFLFASTEERMVAHVKWCIEQAEAEISHLDPDILQIDGMSSPKIRHFLNNLCSYPNTSYLEIGCWKGSTFVSALYNNQTDSAIAIDNWSEFGGPRREFAANMHRFISLNQYQFLNKDCFKIDLNETFQKPVNIYFYDGEHSEQSQHRAFSYFNPVLDHLFIAVIDDWNWTYVQNGTLSAFHELGYEVLYEKALFTPYNGDTSSWWNGLYIAVVKKRL